MKSQKIPAVVKRTAFRVFVLVLTAVMLITSGTVNAQMFDRLQAMYDLAQQTFTLAPEEGVTVELSGMMPKGGSATAVPAETEDEDVIHAYDITIRYQDGREFEPDNDEPISVSFMSDQIAEALKDDETLEVAHIPDNGEEEDVALTSAGGDTATFEAESFSVYLIRTHVGDPLNHNPRRIYHFLSPDFTVNEEDGVTSYQAPEYFFPNKVNEKVSVQAIRTGESLQEIVMPENKTNGVFYGWYVVQFTGTKEVEVGGETTTMYTYRWTGDSQKRVSFNEPINFPDATDDVDIYLAPVYARYRFLTFHQDTEGSQNDNIIVCRKLIILNDEHKCTLSISDVRAPSPSPNKTVFVGWKYTHTEGDSYDQGTGEDVKIEEHVTVNHEGEEIPTSITIEDTRNLGSDASETSLIYDIWPIFKEARWVEFDSGGNGATYRPAQFILLDDDTTRFNNAPVKSGFTFKGWYFIDDNDREVMVTDENADILSNVNEQLTTGMSVNNGKLIMTSAAEESSANRIFRAKWKPNDEADFAVIVWKQKVTDSKYAGEEGYPEKTYDFAGYFPAEGDTLRGPTGVDPRECDAYKNIDGTGKGFQDFTTTRTSGDGDQNFIGFHFSEAVVTDNGYNQPEYKDKINPNNSTVVNVYYDRDLMHITFHYSDSPGGTQVGNYLYVETDGTDGDQYGYVNGEYVLLTTDATFYATSYSFSSKYTASTNNDAVMYGIVGGKYVLLDAAPVFNRTTGNGNYVYTCVGPSTSITNNNPTKYGISSGQFVQVSYNAWLNNWYYNFNNYTGPLYTRDSSTRDTYTGKAYTLSGTTFTQTNATTGTLYGIEDADGNFGTSDGKTQGDKVYRVTFDHYEYSYNGEAYTGTRYLRSADNTFYDGKLYQKTENGFEETTDTTIEPLYGTRTEGVYEELTKQDNTTVYTWYTSPTPSDETRYTGTRYLRYHVGTGQRPYELDFTGLYGSSFDQNNYVYPIDQRWTEGNGTGRGQTLMTSFTRVEGTASVTQYNLYQGTWGATKVIYHLRQRLDGTYTKDTTSELCTQARIQTKADSFGFTKKFDGFEVCAYGNTFSESGSGDGITESSEGNSTTIDSITYIYYRRRAGLELVFNSNYTGGETHVIPNLLYGQSIAGYHDVYKPVEREHYTFAGWYEDSAGTQPFDFDTVIYSSKIVYAKWNKERYRINVDPNGGEMPLGSNYATFFNVDFDELVGQYADLRRNYVEDNNGQYVYANFQYDKVAGAPGLGGSNLAAVYRKAFYIDKTKIEDEYNRVFTVNGVEYSYARSGLTFEEFKSCIDMNRLYAPADDNISYELVSWHKVRADGTVETLPFNFKDFVTEDTTIRARWFEHGGYSLAYDATSGGVTGTMVRYNDPIDQQRKYADKASVVVLYEPSNLKTVGQGGQEEEASEYIFRGWRIVDGVTQEPLEPGVFYDPGETMVLDASHADHQGVIHMKACYEKRTATVRRPDSAAVTLNANSDTASVNEQGLAGDNKEYADIPNKAVKIERQIHNFKLELKNYIKNFTNTDGSKLLGWNKTATSDSYIPEFYADAEVGVNKQGALNAPYNINNLYAVWEPMVYLTLDNATTQAITFNLDFKEHDNSAYAGYVMAMTGEYDRVPFGEMSTDTITVTDNGSGSYSVTLNPDGKVQLVVPSGVLNETKPVSYTVSGNYATTNTKNLFIYNSGSDSGVSIEKRDNNWYLNNSQINTSPIHYENTGTLVKGTQGRLVRFTENGDSNVQVNLTARYYDLETGTWKDATSSSGVNAKLHFLHSNVTLNETFSEDGATTSATLPDNSTHTYRFGMSVEEKDEQNNIAGYNSDYKFIGWYTVDEAAPNTISVDGHSSDFGAADIPATTLAIPTTEKTYYALFVPYIKGDLTITHSQRNDSAGDSADAGLGLSVQYYTDSGAKTEIASGTGNKDRAASVELNKLPNTENVIIDEKNTAGHLVVTVSAKANDYSTYKATYRGQNAVSLDEDADCYKASFDATVANHFADSDTVKGLKVLKPINYYSVFSRKFKIIYTYTARDGQAKDYTLNGSLDSFKDFDLYVLRHTPYVHTLAGDTVWDEANMSIYEENGIKHAKLCEVSAVRAHCSVTINEAGGYTPKVSVPYGETFTEELALNHKAPETNSAGQTFAYWDIKNTDTDKHIANCYSPKFTFKVWNNYTITPVYQDDPEEITNEGQFITIDYIDTSRNPWGSATYSEDNDTTDRSAVTDKVVADLDITFVNNGDKILDAVEGNGNNRYQLGVMFEVVGNTNDGSFDPKDYVNDDEGRLSRVTELLADSKARPSSTKKFGDMTCYYSKINISQNTVSDFNRSEFARSFNAGAVKNYVFRMYAYMVTPEGDKVLSDPHYMTFYGSATPQYALPASGE